MSAKPKPRLRRQDPNGIEVCAGEPTARLGRWCLVRRTGEQTVVTAQTAYGAAAAANWLLSECVTVTRLGDADYLAAIGPEPEPSAAAQADDEPDPISSERATNGLHRESDGAARLSAWADDWGPVS